MFNDKTLNNLILAGFTSCHASDLMPENINEMQELYCLEFLITSAIQNIFESGMMALEGTS